MSTVETQATAFPMFLTRREVAGICKVSTKTLDRWAKDGEGPPCIRLNEKPRAVPVVVAASKKRATQIRRGGTVRYPAAGLEQWLASRPGVTCR